MKRAALNKEVVLRPHQEAGVKKAIKSDGQVLYNWRVGTGKTLGSIAAVEALRDKNKSKSTVVLVPAPLKDNYLNSGIKQFTDSSGVIINSAKTKETEDEKPLNKLPKGEDYYVVSNELFRKHPDSILKSTGADTLVIDEIHKYKDPNSQNYKSIMSVRPQVKNVIALSGTPINNHPQDIVPALDIVTNRGHKLGPTNKFDKRFIRTKRETVGPLKFVGIGPKVTTQEPKNIKLLSREYNNYVHSHHTHDDSIPNKKVKEISVDMSPEQKELYDYAFNKHIPKTTRKKIENNLPINKQEAKGLFSAILNARQASNSVHLLDNSISLKDSARRTPKIKRVLDDVEKHIKNPTNKAIIYTNLYQGGVDVISAGLKDRGIKHGIYAGTTHTKVSERNQAVKDYKEGMIRVIVLNQAATEGVNLPGTTAHFAVDGHFNPAVNEQSEARGIRSGSPVKEVEVFRYKSVLPNSWPQKLLRKTPLMKGMNIAKRYSADEWIYSIANNKDELNKKIMNSIEKSAASDKATQFRVHYNKPAAHKAGKPQVTVHYKGKCHILDNIHSNKPFSGRIDEKYSPNFQMLGYAKPEEFEIRNRVAYIGVKPEEVDGMHKEASFDGDYWNYIDYVIDQSNAPLREMANNAVRIEKEASGSMSGLPYYETNRQQILMKQRAYRHMNQYQIKKRRKKYNRQLSMGLRRKRHRQHIGNRYVSGGFL